MAKNKIVVMGKGLLKDVRALALKKALLIKGGDFKKLQSLALDGGVSDDLYLESLIDDCFMLLKFGKDARGLLHAALGTELDAHEVDGNEFSAGLVEPPEVYDLVCSANTTTWIEAAGREALNVLQHAVRFGRVSTDFPKVEKQFTVVELFNDYVKHKATLGDEEVALGLDWTSRFPSKEKRSAFARIFTDAVFKRGESIHPTWVVVNLMHNSSPTRSTFEVRFRNHDI